MLRIVAKLRKLRKLAVRPLYMRALMRGVAAAVEHERLVQDLEVSTCIDIGANKGQFTLLVRQHHPSAIVYALEPLKEAAEVFMTLFEEDEQVVLFQCAAAAAESALVMNVSGRADSSSILHINPEQEDAFPGTAKVSTMVINAQRVDNLIKANEVQSPLLIKLDVQGYEIEALKGMPELISAADYIYAEVSFHTFYEGQPLAAEVINWMSSKGFDLFIVNDVTHSSAGLPAQADILFVRRGLKGRWMMG